MSEEIQVIRKSHRRDMNTLRFYLTCLSYLTSLCFFFSFLLPLHLNMLCVSLCSFLTHWVHSGLCFTQRLSASLPTSPSLHPSLYACRIIPSPLLSSLHICHHSLPSLIQSTSSSSLSCHTPPSRPHTITPSLSLHHDCLQAISPALIPHLIPTFHAPSLWPMLPLHFPKSLAWPTLLACASRIK